MAKTKNEKESPSNVRRKRDVGSKGRRVSDEYRTVFNLKDKQMVDEIRPNPNPQNKKRQVNVTLVRRVKPTNLKTEYEQISPSEDERARAIYISRILGV